MNAAFLCLLSTLVLAGCAPRHAPQAGGENALPAHSPATSGQTLAVRLDDGDTALVTARQRYISALGEECAQTDGHSRIVAACLRNGAWTAVAPVLASTGLPGEER